MKAYWINVVPRHSPSPLNLGVGITAKSEDDARVIFSAAFGDQAEVAGIRPIRSALDLDQHHVLPNMGNMLARGIWFPLGAGGDSTGSEI